MSLPTSSCVLVPYLERCPEQGGPAERIAVVRVPWTLGRAETADHVVSSGPVSKQHAAIVRVGDRFAVRDLRSTNGTFVNGQRVDEQVLEDGDIIHLAHIEFCFRYPVPGEAVADGIVATQALPLAEPASLIRRTHLLRDLVSTEAVDTLFQPIVDLRTREVIGYEALSRGTHPELSEKPDVLLSMAEQCGMAAELSQLFLRLAVARSGSLPEGRKLFLNVHACEVADARLLGSLSTLSFPAACRRPVVIEVPESSMVDVTALACLRDALSGLGVEIAYDDFGAGQARLVQLTDAPPAYLKLDKGLVEGIEAEPRREMLRALVGVAESLGVRVIAECIETEQIAGWCEEVGCGFGQGFLFGHPAPAAVMTGDPVRSFSRLVRHR